MPRLFDDHRWIASPRDVIADRYVVVRALGRGGFGEVYEVVDRRLGWTRVALKLIPSLDPADTEASSKFAQEVIAMESVNHPNVVRFFDIVHGRDCVGYTLELITTATLGTLLDHSSRLALHEVTSILTQLCLGTQAIHDKQIVHGDLKPDNVLISDSGTCKITDFGIARLLWSRKQGDSPDSGPDEPIYGTIDYVAPEVFLEGTVTMASDIYSIGVIGYLLLTGEAPFPYEKQIDVIRAKLTTEPPLASLLNFECPGDLAIIVQRAIAREPCERFASAAEMGNTLRACRLNIGSGGWDLGSRVRKLRCVKTNLGKAVIASQLPQGENLINKSLLITVACLCLAVAFVLLLIAVPAIPKEVYRLAWKLFGDLGRSSGFTTSAH